MKALRSLLLLLVATIFIAPLLSHFVSINEKALLSKVKAFDDTNEPVLKIRFGAGYSFPPEEQHVTYLVIAKATGLRPRLVSFQSIDGNAHVSESTLTDVVLTISLYLAASTAVAFFVRNKIRRARQVEGITQA